MWCAWCSDVIRAFYVDDHGVRYHTACWVERGPILADTILRGRTNMAEPLDWRKPIAPAVLAIGLLVGCAGISDAEAQTEPMKADCYKVFSEYSKNEFAAAEKYRGKVVIVSGHIGEIGADHRGLPYVTVSSCKCFFPQGSESSLARLSKGQRVTIQAQVTGFQRHGWLFLANSRLR